MGFLKKLEKKVRKPFKTLAPLVGTAVGSYFGGPLGATIGGGIGNALTSRKHPLDHLLGGAALGAGYGALMPQVGNAFGVNEASTLGKIFSMGKPGLGEQLGLGPALSKRIGNGKATPVAEAAEQAAQQTPGLFNSDLMQTLLLTTAVGGALGDRPKYTGPTMDEQIAAFQKHRGKRPILTEAKPKRRRYRPRPHVYTPESTYEHDYFEEEPEQGYAQGGMVKTGYIAGGSGGQTDNRHVKIPEGAYVMDATTTSLMGDGNTENGIRKITELEQHFLNRAPKKNHLNSMVIRENASYEPRYIDAMVSDGEYIIPPQVVAAAGKGDANKGAKEIDKFRKNLRKQKGVKPFLPPKTKSLHYYLGGRAYGR